MSIAFKYDLKQISENVKPPINTGLCTTVLYIVSYVLFSEFPNCLLRNIVFYHLWDFRF